MKWFKKVRELSSQVGMTQRHTQVLGCPSRDVFRFSPAHHSEVVCDFALGEGPSCILCQVVEPFEQLVIVGV